MAQTAFSRQASEAQKFIAFVRSNAGQAVLKKHGFSTP
jgi:ABC-type molybdate transport system substrate-binding protein